MASRTALIFLAGLALLGCMAAQAQAEAPAQIPSKRHRYKLVDMGTLGGPASYLTEPGFGRGELVLNSRGEVAGKSETHTPDNGSGNCPPIC